MSNTGLNSSIYHSTRNYLDVLNQFLVDLNYATEIGKDFDKSVVIEFLTKLVDKNNADPTLWLIRSTFNSYFKERGKDPDKELSDVIAKIKNRIIDKNLSSEVESLVDVLKYQCEESYARLKGKE